MEKPESEMADADHMDRKDITAEEFSQALAEIAKKYAGTKSKNPTSEEEQKKRSAEILKALNSEKNDCNKEY